MAAGLGKAAELSIVDGGELRQARTREETEVSEVWK